MSTKANMINLVHVIALSVAMLFMALSTSHAAEAKESPKLKVSECPMAVQKTLTAEAKGAKIKAVETDTPQDDLEFTAKVIIKKHQYAITVGQDGKLIQKALENEEEKEINFSECPKAVQRALQDEADGTEIETAQKAKQNGVVWYTANVEIGGDPYWITVAENGVLIQKTLDEDDRDEDMPVTLPAMLPSSHEGRMA